MSDYDEEREAQVIVVRGRAMARVRFGEESSRDEAPCAGCSAYYFEYHRGGCEMEQCPACGGQLASCECASAGD